MKRIYGKPLYIVMMAVGIMTIGAAIVYGSPLIGQVRSRWHDQWAASPHNFYPPAHFQAALANCAKCHRTDAFIAEQVKDEKLTEEQLKDVPEIAISCRACHTTENDTNILDLRVVGDVEVAGVTVSAGVSAACMKCHNAENEDPKGVADTSNGKPHHSQAEMLAGTGGITFGKRIGSSVHTLVTFEGCLTCHKDVEPKEGDYGDGQLAGHTFRMSWDGGTADNPNDDIENLSTCQRCHPGLDTFDRPSKGDYDGDGVVEGVQTEVKGLLEQLAAVLPKNADGQVEIPEDLSLTTETEREAAYDYFFVEEDASYGIHNTAYAVNLLRTAYEQVTGTPLPGEDALGAELVATRPTESKSILNFVEGWQRSPHNFDPKVEDFHGAVQRASCIRCHDGNAFVEIQAKGNPAPDEDLAAPNDHGISCNSCHEVENETDPLLTRMNGDVTLANGTQIPAGRAGLCMSCHNGKRPDPEEQAETSFRGPHVGPQAEMLAATGVIDYGKPLRSTAHLSAVKDTCITCHMAETIPPTERGYRQVGGHTLQMRWDGGTPDNTADDVLNVGACQSCHADVTTETGFDRIAREDFDGDGQVEGIQSEVKGLLDRLAAVLPKDEDGNVSIPSDLSLTTLEDRRAHYNYEFVVNDGSYGVHNPLFTVDLLRTTYAEYTGQPITPPASRPAIAWDVNGDGVVNIVDLVIVAQHFGETAVPAIAGIQPSEVTPDVDESGRVDLADLVRVSQEIAADAAVGRAPASTPVASGTVWLNLERLPLAEDGAYIRAQVHVSAADRLAGYRLALDYDPTVMALVGLGNGAYLSRDENAVYWATPNVDETSGRIDQITAVALGGSPAPGQGDDLVSLTFRVNRLDASLPNAIRLRSIQAANPNADLLRMQIGPVRFDPAGATWRTVLLQNYPNPFNPETWIPFDLLTPADVRIDIISQSGEVVRRLDLGRLESGSYRSRERAAYWDGRNEYGERVASGLYFYRIRAGSYSATRKLVILK